MQEAITIKSKKYFSDATKQKIKDAIAKNKESFGYRNSPNTKIKMSESHKGKKLTQEHRAKIGLKKENNPNWQGGKTPINFQIRNCTKNKEWKKIILERDNYTCALCNKRGGIDLHVDHYPTTFSVILNNLITEQGIENALDKAQSYSDFWDTNNGRTLCISCHKGSNHVIKRISKPTNLLTYNGETKTLTKWCKDLCIPHRTAFGRQQRGLSIEKILSVHSLIIEKDNVRTATLNGITKPIVTWCKELGLNSKLVRKRIIDYKWSVEKAFYKPNNQQAQIEALKLEIKKLKK